ncbi:Protein CBG28031 [Caenorhabditis briggsae]|uniref:Protein CBG28031 n=1 Tax=Caenorhabditis briggsae TaxID=6238 RepID=B6IG27_CAEBR|nr:Protein CBG28031 [Caenorhabditis briggsae]CAR98857.1 Protein CBG28031 [Caenorhabditis briggsae]
MEGYGIGGDKGKASGYGLVFRFTKPLSSTGHQNDKRCVSRICGCQKSPNLRSRQKLSSTDGKDERTFAVIIYWPPENVSNVSSTCGHQKNRYLRPRLRWFSTDGTKENQGTELAQEKPFDQQATSSLYVSNAVSDWCKGMCSKKTPKILRTKIEVIFYCIRDMVFPSLRTIVQCILILLAINAILSTLSEL